MTDRKRLLPLKDIIVDKFTEEEWLELAITTEAEDIVTRHPRLFRSMSWGDPDYAGNVLSVLVAVVDRDPTSLGRIESYVSRKFGGLGENISTDPSKNRDIRFTPSVFDVPDTGIEPTLIAVMMPFEPQFTPVYDTIKAACSNAGLKAQRADDIWLNPSIIQDVFSLIFRSRAVICDYSGRNPNVFYEAGIAHTLGKTVIPITQHKSDIPFDVAHHRYIPYLPNGEGLNSLKDTLFNKLVGYGDLAEILG